ncbi:MAG: type II and III secretion system protein [Planctomycetes bacterium]|nr:type II and III secretion system protein [Planctomycetota bacterium]
MNPRSLGVLLVAGASVAVLAGGCTGLEKREEHGLSELGQLIEGAQPVTGTVVEGAEAPPPVDPFALADPQSVSMPAQEPLLDPRPRQDAYIRFGERIIVRKGVGGEEFITKPYTMPTSKAKGLVDLMAALEPFPFKPRPGAVDPATGQLPPLDPGILEYQILENWDKEFYSNLKIPFDSGPPKAPDAVILSDVLVVTASYGLLEQFEDFLDLFAAGGVPQIELEAKIIEVVETDQLDVGGNASFKFGDSNFVQGLDFNLPNVAGTTEAILSLGAVQSALAFDAVLEAVRTWDNVQIDSRPKTVVRAGGVAYLESTTEIPFSEIKTLSTNATDFTAGTVYKKVGVQLYISPRIIGTKMLALDVHLIGSQQVGSQTTFTSSSGQLIEVPVIAYRTAKTVVYLEVGQTLVIGGLTTTRERELISKVPILGDLPLIGLLFRSTFTRTEKQHVLFAISPRILQHSDFEAEF